MTWYIAVGRTGSGKVLAMLLLVVAKTDHATELAHALSAALYPYRRDGVL
jgi:hypothetical protein